MVSNGNLELSQGPRRADPYVQKYSPQIQRQMMNAAIQMASVRDLTMAVSQLQAESTGHLVGFALDNYVSGKALIAESDLDEALAEMLNTVIHNTFVATLKRGETLNGIYTQIHEAAIDEIMRMHPADVEPPSLRRRIVDFLTLRQSELRRYGIEMTPGQQILNGATFGIYADTKLQQLRQQTRNGYGRPY